MTFAFTEEQAAIRDMIRNFAEAEIAPLAAELDKTGKAPVDTFGKLAEMGIMGLNIPQEYGGAGMDEICKVLVISEVARCCASTAVKLAVHLMVNDLILKNGSEEQKRKYLPASVSGKLGAFALTEPGAGSDNSGIRTKVVADGDGYVIDGNKCFITNMGPDEGDYVVVFGSSDPSKGSRGLTAAIVDRDTPGFTIGRAEEKMGIHGSVTSELIFENCRVPKANLMGKEGEGFKVAMSTLDGGRIGIASQSLGIAQGALEAAIDYAKQRVQFQKPIADLQGIQWYIADMSTRIQAARGLIYMAADARSRGEPVKQLASMAKYYASETALFVCDRALQIHGGYGYTKEYPIERMYRDARVLTIYEGTSEIQRMVIAKEALK